MHIDKKAKIICVTGVDGSGKTTLAKYLVEELKKRHHQPVLIWSRFNNFTSKPLLALARLAGKNKREKIDGHVFGQHDFSSTWWLKWPFVFLQTLDVNIATFWKLLKVKKNTDIIIFERSPWDTLADLCLDTELDLFKTKYWSRLITRQVSDALVINITRSFDDIISTRKELKNDKYLISKIAINDALNKYYKWNTITNDKSLDSAKAEIVKLVKEGLVFDKL